MSPKYSRVGLMYFYPRPPRGGRLGRTSRIYFSSTYFYPRPPRGGRQPEQYPKYIVVTISIHALREEGDAVGLAHPQSRILISIHALREEGDRGCAGTGRPSADFYPRPPRGGRPFPGELKPALGSISIHALREEGDARAGARNRRTSYFYPRPPRGGRQQKQRQNLYFLINYTTFCTNLEEP